MPFLFCQFLQTACSVVILLEKPNLVKAFNSQPKVSCITSELLVSSWQRPEKDIRRVWTVDALLVLLLWCAVLSHGLNTLMLKHKTGKREREYGTWTKGKNSLYTHNITLLFTAHFFGDLRLVQNGFTNSSYTSGRLEIYYRGLWKTVCDYLWTIANTRVACHQLGFSTSNTSWSTSSDGGWDVCTVLLLTRPQVCDNKEFLGGNWKELYIIIHATSVNIMNMSIYFACQYLN